MHSYEAKCTDPKVNDWTHTDRKAEGCCDIVRSLECSF